MVFFKPPTLELVSKNSPIVKLKVIRFQGIGVSIFKMKQKKMGHQSWKDGAPNLRNILGGWGTF